MKKMSYAITRIPGKSNPLIYILTAIFAAALIIFALPLTGLASEASPLTQSQLTAQQKADDLANAEMYLRYMSLYADKVTASAVLEQASIEAMIAEMRKIDKWAAYYDPAQFVEYNVSATGKLSGIGVLFDIIESKVTVMGIIADGPAESAGVKAGDIITHVDGRPTAGLGRAEIQALMTGESGTEVRLRLITDGAERQLTLIRADIEMESVSAEMVNDHIARVAVLNFDNNTQAEFQSAVYLMMSQGATAVILDLRSCPGGMVDSASAMLSMFVGAGPTVFIEETDSVYFYVAAPLEQIKLPMVVLVNEYSASAAELLAASIQDIDRALIIGTQTYGKGLVQSVMTLPSGAGIVFTTGKYYSRGYQDIDAQGGLFPDIYVTDADLQLSRAVQVLDMQLKAAAVLRFTPSEQVYYADGASVPLAAPAYVRAGQVYVPVRTALTALGYEVSWHDGLIHIRANTDFLAFDPFAETVIRNKTVIPAEAETISGTTYIPASVLRDIFGLAVTWNNGILTVTR